jgi:serine phosphatase RsbU (regulator of sigma subunit)
MHFGGSNFSLGDSINNVFVDQELKIATDTMIYIFNNGIHQQLGADDEMFNTQRISLMIQKAGKLPCAQQQTSINESIDEWLGDNNQVGDIAIIGVRNTFW